MEGSEKMNDLEGKRSNMEKIKGIMEKGMHGEDRRRTEGKQKAGGKEMEETDR